GCGGGLLYVTREQAQRMAEKGFRWQIDPDRMPAEGRHSWRVACGGEVMSVVRTADLPSSATPEDRARAPKYRVTYGLCSRCNGYELAIRKKLREEQQQAAEAARGQGGRRRAFREEASDE